MKGRFKHTNSRFKNNKKTVETEGKKLEELDKRISEGRYEDGTGTAARRIKKNEEKRVSRFKQNKQNVQEKNTHNMGTDGKNEAPVIPAVSMKGKTSGYKTAESAKKGKNRRYFTKAAARETGGVLGSVIDDTGYDGRPAVDDTEHTGRKKKQKQAAAEILKKTVKAVILNIILLVKLIMSAMTHIVVVAVVAVAVLAIVVISALDTVTYDYIEDDEVNIRALMAQVTQGLSDDIITAKEAGGFTSVTKSGELADFKEVIAVWWTVKNNVTDTYKDYKDDDYGGLKYVFYKFNEVGINADGDSLAVTVTPDTADNVMEELSFSDADREYYTELINDSAVFDSLFGTSELADIADDEKGNGYDKYREWYGEDTGDLSIEFVSWCMNEAGLITEGYIEKPDSAQSLMEQMNKCGFIHYTAEQGEKEGDVIFILVNGETVTGIITGVADTELTVVLNGYMGGTACEEITLGKTNGLIRAYAHMDGFYVMALNEAVEGQTYVAGQGEFAWPVGAECYTVTSAYGRRESPGGVGSTNHMGIDIACSTGTPIVAVKDGTVTAAAYSSSMGYYVKIDHGGITTIYMHNSSLNVVTGQAVAKGQVIAYAGSTGNSTGPHCHLGVVLSGTGYTDPAPYLGIPAGFTGEASEYIKQQ